ncbi:MAG: hypothetical protein M3198_10915 [Actinomycetota bacterium]|nr:hypothetical protein [Actinomycetota bacterium]
MRSRTRLAAVVAALGLVAGVVSSVPAVATHNVNEHSDNLKMLSRKPTKISKNLFAEGSDLAFQKRLLLAGTYQEPACTRS